MLDKLKELNEMRKLQADLKRDLEQIFHTEEKRGVKIVVRGDKRIEKIEVDGEENRELRDAINQAMKQIDKKIQKQMRGKLKGLGLPDL
jgi:DNA-binding protein YbaB